MINNWISVCWIQAVFHNHGSFYSSTWLFFCDFTITKHTLRNLCEMISSCERKIMFYEIFNEHYLSLANFVFHSTWVFVKHSFQSWLLKSALVWVSVFFPSLCVFQFLFFSVAYREIGMTKRTKRILITFFFLSMKEVKYFQPVRVKLWIISFPFSWRRCQYIFVTNVINEKCSPLIVKCMLETQIVIAM